MFAARKIWIVLLSISLISTMSLPALAADPQTTAKDLKGVSPKRFKYLFTVVGGAAVGAGVGAIVGGGNDITKGLLVGSGAASLAYMHSNRRDNLSGWKNWAYVASGTTLGSGLGWTVCGCNSGLGGGALVGLGASALWVAANPQRTTTTRSATNQQP